MNNQKIISNADLAVLLGSSASATLISLHNQIATNALCSVLQVNDLAEHDVGKEAVEVLEHGQLLEFRDFPIDTTTVQAWNKFAQRVDSDWVFRADSHTEQMLWLENSEGVTLQTEYKTGQVLIDYTAGFQVVDKMTISTNPTDAQTFTVEVAGVQTAWTLATTPTGDQIEIGATTDDTASNIATALGSSSTGSIVSFPLGTIFVSSQFSTEVTGTTIPEELKYCVALIAGGSIANIEKSGGVISYKLGQKSVNFRDVGEAKTAEEILNQYISKYSTMTILS